MLTPSGPNPTVLKHCTRKTPLCDYQLQSAIPKRSPKGQGEGEKSEKLVRHQAGGGSPLNLGKKGDQGHGSSGELIHRSDSSFSVDTFFL